MATKLQFYSELAARAADAVTEKRGNWMRFLDTAARLYKYSFPDQLMIHAQRPDATACAEFEFWDEKFDRWIRRGSKGIALIDDSGSYPRLKYVFDVSDTEATRQNSLPVHLWEMRQEHKTAVLAALAKSYDDVEDSFNEAFHNIANQLATEYYNDNAHEICYFTENNRLTPETAYDYDGNPLEEVDDTELRAVFIEKLTSSVAYVLMSRCGIDTDMYLDEDSFGRISDFDTPDMVYALGTAVSDLSEQVLRDIEIVIKKYERTRAVLAVKNAERSEQNYERKSELHTGRGLSAPGHQTGGTAERGNGTIRQIRKDAESVSQGTPDDNLQPPITQREPVSAFEGNGGSSKQADGTGDVELNGENLTARQGDRPHGVDGGNEYAESASGGNGGERTDLQLDDESPPDTLSQPPTPPSKLGGGLEETRSITELLSTGTGPSGSPITMDEVDSILRDGGNSNKSVLRIVAHFSKELDNNIESLKNEYLKGRYYRTAMEGGKGFGFGNHSVCTWFDDEGISLAIGTTAEKNMHRVVIPWETAAARINELIFTGQYISRDVFDEALDNELDELADDLWNFYRDDMQDMPEEWQAHEGGYPGDKALIKSLLEDENERQAILDRVESDVIEFNYNERRVWHDPNSLLAKMQKSMLQPVVAPQSDFRNEKNFTRFITQDEIDYSLTSGSHVQEGKFRILSHFLSDHTDKERIDFLKNEYGYGGGSWYGVDSGWQDHSPGQGITLKRDGTIFEPEAEVNIKYPAVVKRLQKLISEGWYMSRAELDYLPNYERLILVRSLNVFYSDLPEDYERPFPGKSDFFHNEYKDENGEKILDFNYPHEAEWQAISDLLDNPERLDVQLAQMRRIVENTSSEDRYYNSRKSAFENLSAYQNGTYTLFPGVENLPDLSAGLPSETAISRTRRQPTAQRETVIDLGERSFGGGFVTVQGGEQLSLFGDSFFSELPSADEQRTKIERRLDEEAAAAAAASVDLQDDIEAALLNISDTDKERIVAQFNNNPRSRETVNLVKGIYGDALPIPLSQAVKRIAELVTDGKFQTSAEIIANTVIAVPESNPKADISDNKLSDIPSYNVGDTVYLENNTAYRITGISDFSGDITLLDPTLSYPISRVESKDNFEWMLSMYDGNEQFFVLSVVEPEAISPIDEHEPTQEPEPAELDFDTVAQTILERVMNDEDYTNTLANAQSRAVLRNPCTWALEQSIRDHEQDEPEVYRCYFSDDDFNDNLFDFVLKQSWENRVMPETETPVQIAPLISPEVQSIENSLFDSMRYELENRGFAVSDEIIDSGIEEYGEKGHLQDIADYIENEFLSEEEPEPGITPKQPAVKLTDFRITNDHLGEGGAKTKFRNNVDAIQVLHDLEFDKRNPTEEEKEILSRYVGWGGLKNAFEENQPGWEKEFVELYTLLSPEEYAAARASTLNAFYTSPIIIKAMYDTIERLGFKTGNILEPSCGIGNFFGLLANSMMQSKLYGVELDSVTARIAKQLYPNADIRQSGFEKTDFPDNFFDIVIGNVPFGDYGVIDKRYEKQNFSIHNYFFAKALDQVRPGGIVAFVTSKYTMDEKNPKVRKYIAQRAELIGAVRLPNNAFLKNAGTEIAMDIIFLQKRDRPLDIELPHGLRAEWVHLGLTEDGLPVNRYYADNPEMILGTMALDERMNNKYGRDDMVTCLPIEGADLAQQLKTALFNIQGEYTVTELDDLEGVDNHAIPADADIKNFSYAIIDNKVYFRENSLMYPVDLPAMTLERIKGMISLRDCVQKLIALQLNDYSDGEIKEQQQELSDLYDGFIAEYGLINSQANSRAFNADSAYYLLSSLEVIDEDGNLERKADMFTKRTIKQKTIITHVDTASEALAVSLGEKACVDLGYMQELCGLDMDQILNELKGVIFQVPMQGEPRWITADEYLSGNVREKLRVAREYFKENPEFEVNVAALETAQPTDLEASEIAVRLGATWIEPKYVEQFMYELLGTSRYNKSVYQVKYHAYTGEWQVTGKGKSQYSDVAATVTYGTSRMNAYQIIDDTLNLRDVRVYDYKEDADGKERRVLNKKETTLAQQKQELIKQSFKDWLWRDPERRQTLVTQYNEMFNSVRPREYNGSHIVFSGMSPEITLRPHQLNAIAHILYGGNTLLAHEVGAGKTFEMVGAAMESKRLGLCQKSLFSVPNHLTEQWAGEFLRLYPSANILVATKKDFEMRNRKKFCAKIATGDYDAVIVGHSQLEKIPMSRERQERLINEQLWEIEDGIMDLKSNNGERFSIKQLEKTRKNLEVRLAKLNDSKKRDDVVTFEQLGVDRLYVDEAHNFKNLFLYTKMRNVAGLSTSEAQKSSDLFMKCRYLDELTDNKGVIFATGTPISNSMTEMYTMQRYLQYDALSEKSLTHFDSWASIFGETTTSIELAPEGTGYRARTRFAKFHNLPELMAMFKDVADIQTADMLNLPVPNAHYETVIVEPSDLQKEMVEELSERAAAVHRREVEPWKDNMLKITTDGRKIGLDQRLINPLLPDFEGSKVNACANNIFQIWEDTKADKLTQLVFCDFSTPNKDGRFNVYDDIKAKLTTYGIPENEIAFIHDADTETRKKELFAKVRQGKVRVLLGSTFKMGAGTNCQDRLVAIHDADCPWRPADLAQRAGRIVRQGNMNSDVQIFRYATSGTFDSYLWQTVESKQKFISQIMSSKSPVRSCEDCDETALSYAEIKALCAGNPLIAEKMNLDNEVAKLRMLKSEHQSQRYRIEDNILKRYPEQIVSLTERIKGVEKDIVTYEAEKEKCVSVQTSLEGSRAVESKFPGMVINGVTHTEKEPAAKALIEACKGIVDKKTDTPIGEYMGFKTAIRFESFDSVIKLLLRGNMTYQIELGTDTFGNMTRINNALADLPKTLQKIKDQLEEVNRQQEAAKSELEKPFTMESELAEKESRLALLNADLNIDNPDRVDGDSGLDVLNDSDNRREFDDDTDDEPEDDYDYEYKPERVSAIAKGKPSILDGIRNFNGEKSSIVQSKDKAVQHEI